MTAEYAGTKNRVGNGFGIFFMFLYLAFQGYVYVFTTIALLTRQHILRHHNVSVRVGDLSY